MKIALHLEKAARFERALEELDPIANQELAIWAAMHGGIQYMNAALHRLGATIENDAYPSDRGGNFYTPDGSGGWREAPGPLGDLIHITMPPDAPKPREMEAACTAMAAIEGLRPTHVRGAGVFGPAEAERLHADFQTIRRNCRQLLGLER